MSVLLADVVLGPSQFDEALIFTNYTMMIITSIVTFSAMVSLFYGYFRYERYENPAIIKKSWSMMPEKMKERIRKIKEKQSII